MASGASEKLVLGIDIGTTDAKCSIYDLAGTPVASAYREYSMIHPREGWVEEDPNLWWSAVVANLQTCLHDSRLDPARIAAIGVSCTNAFFPLDRDGNPLHNAILQLDQRAASEVDWIREHIGAERIFRVTGNRIARGTFALPTLRWFLKNRPDIIRDAHKFVAPSGFITRKLTGKFSINESRMNFTLLSDIRTGQWDEKLAQDAGMPLELLPRPYGALDVVGEVTREAAELTGLKPGTPVVASGMDTVAAAVGAGAIAGGDTFLAIGTCGRACFVSDRPEFDDRLMNCRHAIPGQWLSIEATNASGASLRWFRDIFGGVLQEACQREGIEVYPMMDRLAEKATAGSGGLIYLPYLSGERCPIWSPDARGVFFGLSLSTTYGDAVRAVMEGVAYSMQQGVKIVFQHSKSSQYLSLGGGIGKSRVWSQILADVIGQPIVRLRVSETETLGDAAMAASGVGLISDIALMARNAARNCETIVPQRENTEIYAGLFELYERLYGDLKGDFALLQGVKQRACPRPVS